MLTCFITSIQKSIPIIPITFDQFNEFVQQQSDTTKNWLASIKFQAKPETFSIIPDNQGNISKVLIILKNPCDFWSIGMLPTALPPGNYELTGIKGTLLERAVIAWGLGAYQFTRYKTANKTIAQLFIPAEVDKHFIETIVDSIYWVRSLINTPTEDMGPEELAQEAEGLAKQFKAKFNQIVGNELLNHNYPTIHAVGRASPREPRLIDIRWGKSDAPKITLVGKGVCFDSGGLDLKTASGMALMKKDMGGAAHVLGLAKMIMATNLPVHLRVLIPAVENVIAGNAFKPGDVIKTRKGLTVEIGNTDAEGRLILCDALAEASLENPDLLIDFATLTGAARVAVGTEIAAMFTDDKQLAEQLMQCAEETQDPIWHMPLFLSYRRLIDSNIADMNNTGNSPYAGAITAGLFLQEFVVPNVSWVHFDLNAWNVMPRPGRPEGGDAMGLRAVFEYLLKKYAVNEYFDKNDI